MYVKAPIWARPAVPGDATQSGESRKSGWFPLVTACSLLLALLFRLPVASSAEELTVTGPIPDDVQEIEITFSPQESPQIVFNPNPPRSDRPRLRPSQVSFDLLRVLAEPTDRAACRIDPATGGAVMVSIAGAGEGAACTIVFQGHTVLDLLSYDVLTIDGTASHPVTLALLDERTPGGRAVPLVRLHGTFHHRLPLNDVFTRLDPRRLAHLALLTDAAPSQVRVDTLRVDRVSVREHRPTSRGLWVWEYRRVLTEPERVLTNCRRFNLSRALLQLPDLRDGAAMWSAYADFFARATAGGVEAVALDGYPTAIYDPTPLVDKIQRLLSLLPSDRALSVQLDIEPYLLPEFSPPGDYRRYVAVLDRIKQVLGTRGRLSVVLPFWLTEQFLDGRPIAFTVMDRVDEVAVMTYRTDMEEVRAIADDWLRYGETIGRPVWLALETRPLPAEQRVTLIREPRQKLADAYLDRSTRRLVLTPPASASPAGAQVEGFRIAHRVTIRPERLTFAGRRRQDVETATSVLDRFPFSSLAGVLIHDYTGYLALQP